MNKLISMTAFVLLYLKGKVLYHHLDKVVNYADFLSQPLELWMFVPCKLVAGVWVVLEEPFYYNDFLLNKIPTTNFRLNFRIKNECREYQEAKSKCLFEIESYTKNIIKSTSRHEYRFTFTNGNNFHFEDDTVYNVERLCELEPTLNQAGKNKII